MRNSVFTLRFVCLFWWVGFVFVSELVRGENGSGSVFRLDRRSPYVIEELGVTLAPIPAGEFVMGSQTGELGRYDDEGPQTRVTLTRDFWLGTHEVTQAQWRSVMGNNPSRWQADNEPVGRISWHDALAFCQRLTAMECDRGRLPQGYSFTLPTEAQWEYACRAGSSTRFYYGDDLDYELLGDYAWTRENSGGRTQPVGQKIPNQWGLFDMHGNNWEWCLDWLGSYPGGQVVDPTGPSGGSIRVLRSGGWTWWKEASRSANRSAGDPGTAYDYSGLRIALMAPEQENDSEIRGSVWADVNGNGVWDRLIVGSRPLVVFVVDTSESATKLFAGTAVGDVNNDGIENTISDAILSGFIALNERLVSDGLGQDARVVILSFDSVATVRGIETGVGLVEDFAPLDDRDGNGVRDVEQILRSLKPIGTRTNYKRALARAVEVIERLNSGNRRANLVFLSDGQASDGSFVEEVEMLRQLGVHLRAFGAAGSGLDSATQLEHLRLINSEARLFRSTDELLALFGGLPGGSGTASEPEEVGIADVVVYLDQDGDGELDADEPRVTTGSGGGFRFSELFAGDYRVRSVLPAGFRSTFPRSDSHELVLAPGEGRSDINFGYQASVMPPPPTGDGFVTRILPDGYTAGNVLQVQLDCQPGADTVAYAVEDEIPLGWDVESISDAGRFDAATRRVKFGPYFDNGPRLLTYEVRVPDHAAGAFHFTGIGSANGIDSEVEGANLLEPIAGHPADVDGDFRISVGEVTGYGAAWKRSNNWSLPPVVIPIAYVTNAGLIWKRGEAYQRDSSIANPPEWWVPVASNVPRRLGSFARRSSHSKSGATRVVKGELVELVIAPSGMTSAYALEELISEGVTVSDISNGGQWDPTLRKIKWGPYFDATDRTLSYRYSVGEGDCAAHAIGVASFDGADVPIEGSGLLCPEILNRNVRRVVASPSGLMVTLAISPEEATAVYAVEERVPAGMGVIRVSDDGSVDSERRKIKWGPFFDNQSREFTYELSILGGREAGRVEFTGTVSVDGVDEALGGIVEYDVFATPAVGPRLSIDLTRGLWVSGIAGGTYELQMTAGLNPSEWHPIARVVLEESSQQWIEADFRRSPQGFYRLVKISGEVPQ